VVLEAGHHGHAVQIKWVGDHLTYGPSVEPTTRDIEEAESFVDTTVWAFEGLRQQL
jgi:hypothetical protein